MNHFGTNFSVQIFGESHGSMVGCIVDGCAPGISISEDDFFEMLDRRKGGAAGTTPRTETDKPEILSGIYNGFTTGAPITIAFHNSNTQSKDYTAFKTHYRPGHADFVAHKKYKGFADHRGGGHFSGRLTACLVAAGVIAKKCLHSKFENVVCQAEVVAVGGLKKEDGIAKAIELNDSLGAVVECVVKNLPVGLGEPFFNSCESVISHLAFSIPAVKGLEFGKGFQSASMRGSEHNDPILDDSGKTVTNNAGGLNGGITNGNDLVFRVAIKPASSTPQPQSTFNSESASVESLEVKGRHDLVIGLRVPPVLEAVTYIALMDLILSAGEL